MGNKRRRPMNTRRHGRLGVATVVAALALAACGRAPAPQEPVRAVKLVTVGQGALEARHEYAAEVRARIESRLGFRVAGKIVRRAVEPGQRVRAGQLLAELDARDYQLAADGARAQVASALAQRDLAAADLGRYESLRAQGFISHAELERRGAQLKAAQSTLQQAQAQLSSQGNQAAYTRLLADADGVVTGIEAEVDQVVAAGTPVVRLAQDGPRDAVFAVPEDRVAALRLGQPVALRAWSGDARLTGQVREIAASADPVTRTFAVKVALAGAAPPLGATLTAVPQAEGAPAAPVLKLPTTALRQEGQGSAVWVYEPASGSVRSQAVQVAGADGNQAVIAAGLTPGMRVVASGVHVLAPGQKVTVYQPKTGSVGVEQATAATQNVANSAAASAASSAAGAR